MATPSATNPDTLVTLKINIEGSNRRFKLPLRDLGASTLPDKLHFLLNIPPTSEAVFERYSDSAASFVTLDPNNASVYKQLYRAAKAKLKLRLRVTVTDKTPIVPKPATVEDEIPAAEAIVEQPAVVETPVEAAVPQSTPTVVESVDTTVNELERGLKQLLLDRHIRNGLRTSSVCTRNMPTQNFPQMVQTSPHMNSTPAQAPQTAREKWYEEVATFTQGSHCTLGNESAEALTKRPIYSVYCNNCSGPIPDAHFHCSTCDDGDYDLCVSCTDAGVHCENVDHWLIRRYFDQGKIVSCNTVTLAPKPRSESKTTLVAPEPIVPEASRTCNSCIEEMTEDQFVTCTTCPDFDLCVSCHMGMGHGHNPKHAFEPAVENTRLDIVAHALLAPGRNLAHNAICDGCDTWIYGVRHKCLDCPDWDYCSTCIVNASFIHPQHRFVPIYEALTNAATIARNTRSKARHLGIYCDGPLCASADGPSTYIRGDRYKCAVCHDTDFCASCEASPANSHNRSHPLIKFKTSVRNVSVTTLGDHEDGSRMPVMGDRRTCTRSKATETTPSVSANAATQVQTVADLKPTEPVKAEEIPEPTVEAKELPAVAVKEELVAHFVRDVVADGTVLPANTVFEQTWYLRNGGNSAWPAGCTVKFVGGDNMCAVDPEHPASVHELVSAAESTTCYTEVAPGHETGFTVLMRTPGRAGNFISYWRLTGPDGDKFGHRLWCDVNVKEVPVIKEEIVEEPKVEAEGSQMIFPKLEKESPTTSIYQEAPAAISSAQEEVDEFDDFADEPLEDDETEDGFMTDEEYDILDGSDEEYLAEQTKATKK